MGWLSRRESAEKLYEVGEISEEEFDAVLAEEADDDEDDDEF